MHHVWKIAPALVCALALACGDDDDATPETGGEAGSGGMAGGSAGAAGARAGSGAAGRAGTGSNSTAGTSGGAGRAGAGAADGGTAGADASSGGPKDIVETALAAGNFTKLAEALTAAGLVDDLQGDGPFTVFAPNDAAFAAFEAANPGVLAGLSKDELIAILTYHVIAGAAIESDDLENGQLAATLAGPVVAVDLSGSKPKINDATVLTADLAAENGVIHVIDKILLPPGDIIEVATGAGDFTKLAAALTAAGLVDDLKGDGPFTVFAPTDDAFDALAAVPTGDALRNVLLYHVLSGIKGPLDLKDNGIATTLNGSPVLFDLSPTAKINGANITVTNVVASNGVIHVIDAVIIPPEDDIVATAVAAGDFTQLAGALTSAGLVDDLQADGPFTVFAPTDDAFEALASVPTGDALRDVLLYHVVQGAVGAGDLTAGSVPTLLANESLTIALENGGVKVNGATVTMANILTSNGVIHVIDQVLVP